MSIEVRPFRRDDREQVAALVNAHVKAVIPGTSVPVNAVLSQLEREPGEFIVDPWVTERATLVAVEQGRIVAPPICGGTPTPRRSARTIAVPARSIGCCPGPTRPTGPTGAGDVLARACLALFSSWGVSRRYADGSTAGTGRLRRARGVASHRGGAQAGRLRPRWSDGDRPLRSDGGPARARSPACRGPRHASPGRVQRNTLRGVPRRASRLHRGGRRPDRGGIARAVRRLGRCR